VKNRVKFNEILKNYNINFNRFGGLKLKLETIIFDIWELKNSTLTNEEILTFEDLSKSAGLNFDGIVYDFTNDILYDEPFLECIKSKHIKIINNLGVSEDYFLVKTKKLNELYGFTFDEL